MPIFKLGPERLGWKGLTGDVIGFLGAGASSSAFLLGDGRSVKKVFLSKEDCQYEYDRLRELTGPDNTPWLTAEAKEENSFITKPCGVRLQLTHISKIVLEDFLCAICYLHSQGFGHNDLRPANLLVVQDEAGDFRGLLIDFGFVTKLGEKPAGGSARIVDREGLCCTEGDFEDFVRALRRIFFPGSGIASEEQFDAFEHALAAAKENDVDGVLKNLKTAFALND